MSSRSISLRTVLCACALALPLAATAGVAPAFAEAPRWDIVTRSAPRNLPPGGKGEIVAIAINLGDASVTAPEGNPVVISDTLPKGLVATGKMQGFAASGADGIAKGENPLAKCEALPALRCKFAGTLPPYIAIEVHIPVTVEATPPTKPDGELLEENTIKVEGGNATPKAASSALTVSAAPTPFGIEHFELSPEEENGTPDLQAGSHPFALTTTLEFNQSFGLDPLSGSKTVEVPQAPAQLKNLNTKLPPGLLGNITVAPQCSEVDFSSILPGNADSCPAETAIGVAVVTFDEPRHFDQYTASVPVFNLVPAAGEPARFGLEYEKVPIVLDTAVRTGEGYGVEVTSKNTSQTAEVLSVVLTIWGVPAAHSHDNARGWECLGGGFKLEGLTEPPPCSPAGQTSPHPYLTLPTYCSQPLASSVEAQSWQPEAAFVGLEPPIKTLEGCNRLPFEPSMSVQPDKTTASTPSGLNVEINVPQDTTLAANGLAEADVKATTLTLPEGMMASAGASNGLEACSAAQLGFNQPSNGNFKEGLAEGAQTENNDFSRGLPEATEALPEPPCPRPSKVGTVSIKSPLLEHELTGSVYLGAQNTDPFTSPLVFYIVATEPVTGVIVKLAGEININPETGQLVSIFRNTPPLPFQTLKLSVFDGPRASQATPSLCRTYSSKASFNTWSGEEATEPAPSSFTTTPNPDGQPCPSSGPLPFAPSFQAGSTSSQAGGFTPFTLQIARPDGDAALKTISMQLPPGLAAVLASVPLCPEPQAADGTCSEESLIGHSSASSGLGSDPFTLPGKVYLTGPYNGAPFGLSAVTPATNVGPFHVGTVVARSSITVNPETAAATINTAASQFFPLQPTAGEQTVFAGLPELIKGVPAQIKQLDVTVDRPGFEFNPTNCAPMAITGTLTGYEGTSEPVSAPFQASNCAALPFAPKISATVSGQGSKVDGVTFDVTLESAGLGQANIHKVDLTLPKALPSRLETIQKACKDEVFVANPAACDEGSVIGEGIVHTPVFKNPLRGPAYLVSHGGAEFPDVEFVLQGEGVTIIVDGKTFIENGITYSKFETSPDAPFTKFESIFPAGPHSALGVDSLITGTARNLCKTPLSIPTEMEGQNGALIKETTPIKITGCSGRLGVKETSAQLLAKALKTCRTKYKGNSKKAKRVSCEKQARKKYGPKKKAKKSSKKK